MLFVVATPIGHLGDFSHRAEQTLKDVDYILCEDTRVSRVLLERYGIKKALRAFHKFSEAKEEEKVLADLKQGKTIALISDAGTPGLSDPGEKLIAACVKAGIVVQAIPGPSALLAALVISGFSLVPFQFVGFLPKRGSEYTEELQKLLTYPGTSVLYETPHRLKKLLALLPDERLLSISRELSKKFEETHRGQALELRAYFDCHPPKGEFVVVIAKGEDRLTTPPELEEAFTQCLERGLSRRDAIREISQKFRLSKKNVVQRIQNSL